MQKGNLKKKLAEGNGGNKRPFFAYVKTKTDIRPSIGPLKDSGGQTVTSDEGMAEILNSAFQEAFTREYVSSIPVPSNICEHSFLESVRFQPAAVKRKIRELRMDAASGPDGLGPKVLQKLQDQLSPILAAIFRKSLDEGVVPHDWKEENVTPIFKKGTKSSPGNYKPVSLTCISCKLMESILRDAIGPPNSKQVNQGQPAWIHERQVVCHKSSGIFGEGNNSGGWRRRLGCHIPGLCKSL
jgi:hypothetical protein